MTVCSSMSCAPNVRDVGGKFASLCHLPAELAIPRGMCVNARALAELFSPAQRARIAAFFEDARATVGTFLLEAHAEFWEDLSKTTLSEGLRQELQAQLQQTFGSLDGLSFAVRSSATTEDGVEHSYAGVYESILGVSGFEEICCAVLRCFLSYYDYRAVSARVRHGDLEDEPRMAVIVQELVKAEFSGVAFAAPSGETDIECVEGLGDALVSGTRTPNRYSSAQDAAVPDFIQQVVETARRISLLREHACDIEWAYAGGRVFVLQVRPVTRALDRAAPQLPFRAVRLYLDPELPADMSLGESAEVFASYSDKRGFAYRAADALGIRTGHGWVVQFNAGWLRGTGEELRQLLAGLASSEVVIDLGSNLRQVVLPRAEVFDYLTRTLPDGGTASFTLILREFVRGELGFIAQLTEDGRLLIEYSADGLLKINRGLSHCSRLVATTEVDGQVSIECDDLVGRRAFEPRLALIRELTRQVGLVRPKAQLEWVMDHGEPCFVDYSGVSVPALISATTRQCISPGAASGPALNLGATELLERLSIGPAVSVGKSADASTHRALAELLTRVKASSRKPIVFVDRPYAVLSVLFGSVAGFVFREGSLLCHLGILLRESQIPAAIAENFEPSAGTPITLSDGRVFASSNDHRALEQ